MTRTDIQTEIANTIKAATGCDVEVTVSSSIARGRFISIAGTLADIDAARRVMDASISIGAGVRFAGRDIDPDDDFQVDFYSFTA